jgi:hypothetical protein
LVSSSARAATVAAIAPMVALAIRVARADELERSPLPEPILTETATDIDSSAGGELELALNGYSLLPRTGGARAAQASIEAEYRITRLLGVRVEPWFARTRESGAATFDRELGIGGALAVTLLHDFAHDLHLQAEIAGRTPGLAGRDAALSSELNEAALPYDVSLRAAMRVGRFTLRPSIGAEAGGTSAHVPLRASLAVLTGLDDATRFGFFGLEIDSDFARRAPLVLAPNLVADLTSLELPFRLGLALPLFVGRDRELPFAGVYLRLLFVSEREAAYGAGHH